MKVFTEAEATTVERPDSGPWTWPEPVDVMISNTAKFDPVGSFHWREDRGVYDHNPFDLSRMGDPLMFAIALNMLETLYQAGYAVVKLDAEEDADGDLTRAELLAALKVELRENLSLRDGVVTAWMGELGTTLVPAIAAVLQATEPQEARP